MFNPPKKMSNGPFTIIDENGRYGLKNNEGIIILCLFEEMHWVEDYLCIFDGEKWAVIDYDRLHSLHCVK